MRWVWVWLSVAVGWWAGRAGGLRCHSGTLEGGTASAPPSVDCPADATCCFRTTLEGEGWASLGCYKDAGGCGAAEEACADSHVAHGFPGSKQSGRTCVCLADDCNRGPLEGGAFRLSSASALLPALVLLH